MKIFSIVCIVACLCGLVTSFRSLPHVPVSANKRSVSLRMTSDDQELRTYAGYNVYKGKGAINIKPIPPSFKINGKSQVVDRDGALLFEFAPIGNGPREYDWTKKAGFSMSVGECGEMMRAKDGVTTEFLHDPGAGTPDAGKMTKKLKWSPTPDGKGMFVTLSVTDKVDANGSVTYSLPVTFAEVEVIKSIMSFCLPRFLGLHKMF